MRTVPRAKGEPIAASGILNDTTARPAPNASLLAEVPAELPP